MQTGASHLLAPLAPTSALSHRALTHFVESRIDVCFRGLWNVPFVSNCYLINATIIANKATRPSYEDGDLDTEMAFARGNRQKGLFMYVSNRLEFGHLVNPDTYDIRLTYPDMYQIMDNKLDWEKRYIHPNYSENFNADKKPIQVNSRKVYRFFFFCKDSRMSQRAEL